MAMRRSGAFSGRWGALSSHSIYDTEVHIHERECREIGMKRYDPLKAPDPKEWLSLDEQQRIALAEDYHQRARIRPPNAKIHAVVHAIVENQVAMGDETPVRRTVERLMAEGLDRHEAIHAVGMILMEFIADIMRQPDTKQPERWSDPNHPYWVALEKLTAESWRRSG